ncbi:phosphohistidine phosphatase SixA [Trichococcus patagoniensis]|uniref:Phosphohistidine phosphatase SixA n=1 Tax=Trichococcus patagoniensis TaxID=382641 RepID=A0A2T5IJW8_9LACT|nr:CHAD domain-containing protein [Trichococcus patagoniensis]PTQ84107.1 phosphohistidine phosphatase SixA [Trichococcus patagoniensis]
MGGQLILIRHGIAEERTPEGDDFYRKLTEAGVEEMNAFLSDIAPLLTEHRNLKIWTSPLVRARQTAELVGEATAVEEIQQQEFLATGDYVAFMEALEQEAEGFTVALVGHEPYMSIWTKELIGAAIPFKKGAVAFFTVDFADDPIGNLEWLVDPGESAKCKHDEADKKHAADKHEGTADCGPCDGEDTLYADIIKEQMAGVQHAYAAYQQDPVEPESAHDLRVTIRQLRALLNFNKANGEEKYYREAGEDWREIATTFGYLRELDVLMEECRELRGLYPAMLAEDGQVMTWLMEERQAEQDSIHELITSGALTERILDAEAATAQYLKSINLDDDQQKKATIKKLEKMKKRLMRKWEEVDFSNHEETHSLRINAKKLRYAATYLAPITGEKDKTVIKEMKKIQTGLGTLCDLDINGNLLLEMAENTEDPELQNHFRILSAHQFKRREAILNDEDD